ncbi:MAG: TlyA family RNA methyltransferase [Microbacterium sp.]
MTARLDAAVASRGLARSRTRAAELIAEGRVTVDGAVVRKASHPVSDDAVLRVQDADAYVSRAAHKLIAALDAFAVEVAGRLALDLGASTGGFTQLLCERGTTTVIAADVGHGQIAPSVAADPRVRVVEGFNVRYMTAANLADASGIAERPELITGDLSFISLTLVVPSIVAVAAPDADVVLLVKPQFEVGRQGVREGIVVNPQLRIDAVRQVLARAWEHGLGTLGVRRSPIEGASGNVEVLVHLAPGRGGHPSEWDEHVKREAGAP